MMAGGWKARFVDDARYRLLGRQGQVRWHIDVRVRLSRFRVAASQDHSDASNRPLRCWRYVA